MNSRVGSFDFTITREDTNRAALAYWKPIVDAYIEKHACHRELNTAAYFQVGFLTGSAFKLGVRDVIELREMWPGTNESSFSDAYGEHSADLDDDEEHPDLFDGVPDDFYLESWASLWISIHNEIYVHEKLGIPLPARTAAYYLGKMYAEIQLEIIPPKIARKLESMLAAYVTLDKSLKTDLKLDASILKNIPSETIPYGQLME